MADKTWARQGLDRELTGGWPGSAWVVWWAWQQTEPVRHAWFGMSLQAGSGWRTGWGQALLGRACLSSQTPPSLSLSLSLLTCLPLKHLSLSLRLLGWLSLGMVEDMNK